MNITRADFFSKVAETPELQQKVDAIMQPSVEAAAEALAAIAREAGYPLTAADFLPQSGELAEEDLASIAGGAVGDITLHNEGGRDWQWMHTEVAPGKWTLTKTERARH
jgi:predicted ribosomally synthesized peptide with nif11-like leader